MSPDDFLLRSFLLTALSEWDGRITVINPDSSARDRVVIEARESRSDGLDLRVELVVGNQPVDVSVLLRARSIEIVGHEEDLECPAATD